MVGLSSVALHNGDHTAGCQIRAGTLRAAKYEYSPIPKVSGYRKSPLALGWMVIPDLRVSFPETRAPGGHRFC